MRNAPSTAEPTSRPEMDGAGVPEGIARLLHVLQWIIGYGRTFVETLHQRSAEEFHSFARRYRRSDFGEIIARIKRGLLLAAALEETLLKRARTGRDIAPVDVRYATPRADRTSDNTNKRRRVRHTKIVDMPPDRLPTAEEIAAELRRRPLGAVLVDICRDLGIQPGDLTREQWEELRDLILRYGGNPNDVIFAEWFLRLKLQLEIKPGKQTPEPADTGAPCNESARPTGPPPLAQAA